MTSGFHECYSAIYSGLGILCSVDQRAAKAYASTKV